MRESGPEGDPFPHDRHPQLLPTRAVPPVASARPAPTHPRGGRTGTAAASPLAGDRAPAPGSQRDAGSALGPRRAACERDVGQGGTRGLAAEAALLATYVWSVLPLVDRVLARWQALAAAIPDPELRRQALASIRTKRFHCEGGAVFAAAVPPARRRTLVEAVVALQTISDYLDNLCDRSESLDPADYRQLHRAMLDAVTPAGVEPAEAPSAAEVLGDATEGGTRRGEHKAPETPRRPGSPPSPLSLRGAKQKYYLLHPHGDDGGYLEALVASCRAALATFPGYGAVAAAVHRLVSLYNDLQVNKHGHRPGRRSRLEAWYRRKGGPWRAHLAWWEFAAACGSTLGVFALFREALLDSDPPAPRVRALLDAYFPWIGGLHILLDYLIDQAEDRAGGDLNLVEPYGDAARAAQRLTVFVREAGRRAGSLPDAAMHRLVVDGLLGLYLTDPKVAHQRLEPVARQLLAAGGTGARLCFVASRFVRRWRGAGGP
ncbi:MAG TPA: tetraprenyl-beta-curcumene synthase family protein [Thermaerobacter sp.]